MYEAVIQLAVPSEAGLRQDVEQNFRVRVYTSTLAEKWEWREADVDILSEVKMHLQCYNSKDDRSNDCLI